MTRSNRLEMLSGDGKGDTFQFELEMEDEPGTGEERLRRPRKLGDGNFGIVLAAKSPSGGAHYALKVIYDHVVPSGEERQGPTYESDLARVKEELSIGIRLPQNLNDLLSSQAGNGKLDGDFESVARRPGDHIVLPLAYSHHFGEFCGREALARADVKLSSHAYLMNRYDCTLKDLIEGAGPDRGCEVGSGSGGRNAGDKVASGYPRLRDVAVEERERSVVPILGQVARGLQALHAGGFRHQDIKPANIYYRRNASRAEFRLGDLGFLRPADNPAIAGSTAVGVVAGLGTRHYRSIEQRDFSDTAECDVHLGEGGKWAILSTRDPKFLETNIRPGDLAYFAKSSLRRLFEITDLERDPVAGEVKVHVRAPRDVWEGGDGTASSPLVEDRNTQVAFLKNPTAKTDLFGLGAILFDVVSGGESPEGFYELLRRFDRRDVDISARITSLYDTWCAGVADDTDVAGIFRRTRGPDGKSVSVAVLSFLLRCMMSNAEDGFYRGHGFERAEAGKVGIVAPGAGTSVTGTYEKAARVAAVQAWSKVIGEIRKLEGDIGAGDYGEVDTNVLTGGKGRESGRSSGAVRGAGTPSGDFRFADVMQAFREGRALGKRSGKGRVSGGSRKGTGASAHDVRSRWALSCGLLGLLVQSLDRSLYSSGVRGGGMFSLAPEHLAVRNNAIELRRHVLSEGADGIYRSMQRRDPLITGIRPFTRRYEPIWWRYRTRRVELSAAGFEEADSAGMGGDLRRTIKYADFSAADWRVGEGDFVLPSDSTGRAVFEVVKVEKEGVVELAVKGGSDSPGARAVGGWDGVRDGYLVKRPDRIDYYAGMLSVYMFHLFLSDGDTPSSRVCDFPAAVYAKLRDYPVRFGRSPGEAGSVPRLRWLGRGKVAHHTSELILWLGLGGYHDQTYAERAGRCGEGQPCDREGVRCSGEGDRWSRIKLAVDGWREAVGSRSGVRDVDLVLGLDGSGDAAGLDERFSKEVRSWRWESACNEYLRTAVPSSSPGAGEKGVGDGSVRGSWSRLVGSEAGRWGAGGDGASR